MPLHLYNAQLNEHTNGQQIEDNQSGILLWFEHMHQAQPHIVRTCLAFYFYILLCGRVVLRSHPLSGARALSSILTRYYGKISNYIKLIFFYGIHIAHGAHRIKVFLVFQLLHGPVVIEQQRKAQKPILLCAVAGCTFVSPYNQYSYRDI